MNGAASLIESLVERIELNSEAGREPHFQHWPHSEPLRAGMEWLKPNGPVALKASPTDPDNRYPTTEWRHNLASLV